MAQSAPNSRELKENRRELKENRRELKVTSSSNPSCTSVATPLPLIESLDLGDVRIELENIPVLVFPVAGTSAARTWSLTAEQVESWERSYPGVDVTAECRKALAYLEANAKKTAKGMPRFLVAWLNRTTNQARSSPTRPGGVGLPSWAVKAR